MVIFLAPAVALYLLVYLYPTVRTTLMSFFTMDSVTTGMANWSFVGLQNFATRWQRLVCAIDG